MGTLELKYALPESRMRIRSSVTTTVDTVLETESRAPQSTVTLEVGASSWMKKLRATSGGIFNTGLALEVTDEGLLKSSSLESTGELGKVLTSVVGAATTVAGALLSPAGVGGAVATGAYLFMAEAPEVEPEAPTPADLEAAAFAESDSEAAALRSAFQMLVKQVNVQILQVAQELAAADTNEGLWALQRRLLVLQRLLEVLQARLDVLNGLFKAWRATTIQTEVAEYERLISLEHIRKANAMVSKDGIQYCGEVTPEIEFAWSELGVAVTVEGASRRRASEPMSRKNQILVRMPRLATINVYEKDKDGKPVLKQSKPHLVMDSTCEIQAIRLRKSLFAKRSVSVGFSDLGALKSYAHQADSTAAAIASTAESLPGTVTASLENVVKAKGAVDSLRSRDLQQRLAKVKAEAELKQQELNAAGLSATAKDHGALERLKQEVAKLEQEDKLDELRATPVKDDVATEIEELKQQVELLKLRDKLAKLR
jgi:hypothetical protein